MCDVDSNVGDKVVFWKAEERCRFRSGSEKGRRDHTGKATLQTREQRTSGEKAQTNASQELPEPQSAHPRGRGQSRWGGVFLKAQLGWGGAAGGESPARKAWGEREGGPPPAPLGRPGPPQWAAAVKHKGDLQPGLGSPAAAARSEGRQPGALELLLGLEAAHASPNGSCIWRQQMWVVAGTRHGTGPERSPTQPSTSGQH